MIPPPPLNASRSIWVLLWQIPTPIFYALSVNPVHPLLSFSCIRMQLCVAGRTLHAWLSLNSLLRPGLVPSLCFFFFFFLFLFFCLSFYIAVMSRLLLLNRLQKRNPLRKEGQRGVPQSIWAISYPRQIRHVKSVNNTNLESLEWVSKIKN